MDLPANGRSGIAQTMQGPSRTPPPADPGASASSPAGEAMPFARRGYHHGQLRAALLHAARNLLRERGTGAFSLADAAKLAGVSPAAPYRHFRDREALLGAVARDGFTLFASRLAQARQGHADPREAFVAMGRAYLAFARDEPGLYAALYSQDAPLDEEGRAEATKAFTQLVEGIADILAAAAGPSGFPAPDPLPIAMQVWAMSHGVAGLWRNGRQPGVPLDPEQVLFDGVSALIEGAMLAARRRPVRVGLWNRPPEDGG
jgi:AcrR family transcriptional regulator